MVAIVPMPLRCKLHVTISERLARLLIGAIKAGVSSSQPDLFLCAIAWGWMCAEGAVGTYKVEKVLGRFATLLEFTRVRRRAESWPVVEEIMRSFLWMEVYCEEPMRKFWAAACGLAEGEGEAGESP